MSDTAEHKKNLARSRVKKAVAKVFEIEESGVDLNMSPDNVELWDSFGQLALVDALEKEFSITFEMEEVFNIVSVRDIYELLEKKKII